MTAESSMRIAYSLADAALSTRYRLRRFAVVRSTPLKIRVNVVASISIAMPLRLS
jgi:hypothetical protein